MSSTTKLVLGLGLGGVEIILVALGLSLCSTGIGAVIGIPMLILAAMLFVVSFILLYQGGTARQKEVIAAGVSKALQKERANKQQ